MNEIIEQLQHCSLEELITIRKSLSTLIAARIRQARLVYGLWPKEEEKRAIESAKEDWNENAYL